MKLGRIVAHKNTSFPKTSRKQTVQGEYFMNERQPNSSEHKDRSGWQPWHSVAVTDVAFHSTHRKGYQSKLLFFHSKGGRCSFWGLLYCDDRRSPWWASRDELQHDHIRSDTVMISMNFNSYASLVIFFIILVLFCFVFDHKILLTIWVLAVFGFFNRT